MTKRMIHHYAITSRQGVRLGLVSPGDFGLSLRAASARPVLPRGTLAYCADQERERVLFTCHAPADLPAMFAGPFLFGEQLLRAGSVLSIPFERLEELGLAVRREAPVFIFSAGRVGSTLLARLLTMSSLPCASEPDLLTQIACFSDTDLAALPSGGDSVMAGACLAAIGSVLGPTPFIKLRSQCNARPKFLLDAAPHGRAIFLLRDARAWAVSRHRAFGEAPSQSADVLRQAVDALDFLVRAPVELDVLWYEEMVNDPLAALRLCAPDHRPDPLVVAAVMGHDSQAGTRLARDLLGTIEVADDFTAGFQAAWDSNHATTAWSETTQAMVARMWRRGDRKTVLF